MTEEQLKDTIIAQAVRITELEEDRDSEKWMSNYYRQDSNELRVKIAQLEEEIKQAKATFDETARTIAKLEEDLAEAEHFRDRNWDYYMAESDDVKRLQAEHDRLLKAIGLDSEPTPDETPFADLTVQDLNEEETND